MKVRKYVREGTHVGAYVCQFGRSKGLAGENPRRVCFRSVSFTARLFLLQRASFYYSAPLSITVRLFFYYSTPLFYYSAPLFITVRLFLLQRAYSFHSARQKQRAALFSVCGEATALCRTHHAAVFIRVASSTGTRGSDNTRLG